MLPHICSVVRFYLSAAGCGKICNWRGGDTYGPIGENSGLSTSVRGIISATVNRRAYTQGEIGNFISSEVEYLQVIIAAADCKTGPPDPQNHSVVAVKLPGLTATVQRHVVHPGPKRLFPISSSIVHTQIFLHNVLSMGMYVCMYGQASKTPLLCGLHNTEAMQKTQNGPSSDAVCRFSYLKTGV